MSTVSSPRSSPARPARRRPLLSLNLAALVAFVVPALLILGSMGFEAFAPGVLVAIGALFAAGVLACAAAMALLAGQKADQRNPRQSVVLLLPVAGLSMAGAFAILFGLSL